VIHCSGSRRVPTPSGEEFNAQFFCWWKCGYCDEIYVERTDVKFDPPQEHHCWLKCGHNGCTNKPTGVLQMCTDCRCVGVKLDGVRCTQSRVYGNLCRIHHDMRFTVKREPIVRKGWHEIHWGYRLSLPACYAIFRDGNLWYVGSAINLAARLSGHEKIKRTRKSRLVIKARYFPRESGMWLACEYRLIQRLNPPGNTMYRPTRAAMP